MAIPTPIPAPQPTDDRSDWETVRRMGHELNNLISAIGGYTDMVMEDAPEDAALAADLGHIRDATQRVAAIVDALMTLSRQRSGWVMRLPSDR
jgi:signal transduction histidine kinase